MRDNQWLILLLFGDHWLRIQSSPTYMYMYIYIYTHTYLFCLQTTTIDSLSLTSTKGEIWDVCGEFMVWFCVGIRICRVWDEDWVGGTSRGWFNITISFYQYRKSHCGDKTIFGPSQHKWISYTGKITSWYWIRTCSTRGTYCSS